MPVVGRLNQYGSMLVTEFDETTANGPSITGLGTYYATEFSENVGIETTITANVFAPYDVVYDEFAGVLYGPGQGTYMRHLTDKSVIVPSALRYEPIPSGMPSIVRPVIFSPAYARGLMLAALVVGKMYSGFVSTEFATADPAIVATIATPATTL